MNLAKQVREKVGSDANCSFAGGGYRLDLNPVEDRFTETGFILWREGEGGPVPVASGRAVDDDLVLDDAGSFPGGEDDLHRLVADLLAGDPIETRPRSDGTSAVPTGA